VFTARYALSPYIKQIHSVFKGLIFSKLTICITAIWQRSPFKPMTKRQSIFTCISFYNITQFFVFSRVKINYSKSFAYCMKYHFSNVLTLTSVYRIYLCISHVPHKKLNDVPAMKLRTDICNTYGYDYCAVTTENLIEFRLNSVVWIVNIRKHAIPLRLYCQ
jgi:hypothetical protein